MFARECAVRFDLSSRPQDPEVTMIPHNTQLHIGSLRAWIRQQAAGACSIFSACAGALICGAAGLLKGRRATTHWAPFHLLSYFGAIPINERVVVDGAWVFAAGLTAGIDGALRLAAELRGDEAAQAIQLDMVYAPEPPFSSGTPETAPPAILKQARQSVRALTARREGKARRIAAKLGIAVSVTG
jgi:cyclohexyl-isocyanide hydratase